MKDLKKALRNTQKYKNKSKNTKDEFIKDYEIFNKETKNKNNSKSLRNLYIFFASPFIASAIIFSYFLFESDLEKFIAVFTNEIRYNYLIIRGDRAFNKENGSGTGIDNAKKYYSKAIKLIPSYITAYQKRGIANNYYAYRDGKNAIDDFSKAISLQPNNPKIYIQRGIAKTKIKNYNGAIIDFSKAISLDSKESYAFIYRGITKHKKSDFNGAISDFSIFIKLNPRSSYAFNLRGKSKHQLGQYEKAIIDFSKAISLDSKNSDAFTNRGLTKYEKKDFYGAIDDYKKALLLPINEYIQYGSGQYRSNLLGMAYYSLGNKYKTIGDNNKVCQNYQGAAKNGYSVVMQYLKEYCPVEYKRVKYKIDFEYD